ncbi:hypothetical protein RHGRI_016070 [Rhododendron griersonianum]|uniref:Uncharacterized protein n=1 Tax=Rhododendron griersonianum TaxID=479676 RepID=A0AAV6JPM0_9ERIC|nr:hypothetical protein RHGRI_016070 [Rhododendron griersonianum]
MEQDLHEDEIDVEHEDAALIVSKREKASKLEKAQTRKRKCFEVSSTEESHESDTIMTTVSQPDQNMKEVNESMEFHSAMYSPEIDGGNKYMIAKAVATLSLSAMNAVCFFWKEELLSLRREDFEYKIVRESVLSSVAKFVLSIFSVEDLERIYNLNEISNDFWLFTYYIFLNFFFFVQSKCDPFVAVTKRRVEVDKFSTLREHDVCDVIQQHENRSKYTFFEFEDVSESDVSIAMMELDNYVPLQADREIQFTLELARRKSFLVTDTLIFESLMGIKISDSDFCPTSPDESAPFDPQKVAFVREQLIDAIIFGRPCTDELIEVIKIADYERGMRRQHFISMQHILFGLSLSRVGDIVRQGIFDNIELPSDLPMLGIYKLSSDAAKFLEMDPPIVSLTKTSEDDAKVGLEHFVFAILYGKQEKDGKALEEHSSLVLDYEACDTQLLDSLRKSATNCGVESFEDWDIAGEFILPDERDGNIGTCSLTVVLKRLNKALSEGMKLPLIREKV